VRKAFESVVGGLARTCLSRRPPPLRPHPGRRWKPSHKAFICSSQPCSSQPSRKIYPPPRRAPWRRLVLWAGAASRMMTSASILKALLSAPSRTTSACFPPPDVYERRGCEACSWPGYCEVAGVWSTGVRRVGRQDAHSAATVRRRTQGHGAVLSPDHSRARAGGASRPACGSLPLEFLVECRGHLRPRREVCIRHDGHTIVTLSATAKALIPPDERTGGPKFDGRGRHDGRGEAEGGCRCHGHGGHGAHGGPRPPPGRVTKADPVTAVTAATVAHAPRSA
jgi:hypothetical protein